MVGWYSRTRNTVLNIYVVDTTCLILRIETHEIQEVTLRIRVNFILRGESNFRNSKIIRRHQRMAGFDWPGDRKMEVNK